MVWLLGGALDLHEGGGSVPNQLGRRRGSKIYSNKFLSWKRFLDMEGGTALWWIVRWTNKLLVQFRGTFGHCLDLIIYVA